MVCARGANVWPLCGAHLCQLWMLRKNSGVGVHSLACGTRLMPAHLDSLSLNVTCRTAARCAVLCWDVQAKELVMRSLPVPESVLKRHCEAVAPIFAKKKMQTLQVGAGCCCCRTRAVSYGMQQSGFGGMCGRLVDTCT